AGAARSGARPGFWSWASHKIVARPLLVLSVAAVVLLPLVAVGLQAKASYRATEETTFYSTLQGVTAIGNYRNAGETGPITVMLVSPGDWASRDGRAAIDHVTRSFASLDNVAEVRSLTQSLGKPAHAPWQCEPCAALKHYVGKVSDHKGKKSVTRLEVV